MVRTYDTVTARDSAAISARMAGASAPGLDRVSTATVMRRTSPTCSREPSFDCAKRRVHGARRFLSEVLETGAAYDADNGERLAIGTEQHSVTDRIGRAEKGARERLVDDGHRFRSRSVARPQQSSTHETDTEYPEEIRTDDGGGGSTRAVWLRKPRHLDGTRLNRMVQRTALRVRHARHAGQRAEPRFQRVKERTAYLHRRVARIDVEENCPLAREPSVERAQIEHAPREKCRDADDHHRERKLCDNERSAQRPRSEAARPRAHLERRCDIHTTRAERGRQTRQTSRRECR
jgi:hypothetical protein